MRCNSTAGNRLLSKVRCELLLVLFGCQVANCDSVREATISIRPDTTVATHLARLSSAVSSFACSLCDYNHPPNKQLMYIVVPIADGPPMKAHTGSGAFVDFLISVFDRIFWVSAPRRYFREY